MGKLSLGLGLGVGYVLGAQAGRARFEQIKQAATSLVQRPEVQDALGKAQASAPAPLRSTIEKLTSAASGGQSAQAGSGDQDAQAGSGDQDAVSRTSSPTADAGGPPNGEAPVPDPLVPPAKSPEF